jgi:hypothetical protein
MYSMDNLSLDHLSAIPRRGLHLHAGSPSFCGCETADKVSAAVRFIGVASTAVPYIREIRGSNLGPGQRLVG